MQRRRREPHARAAVLEHGPQRTEPAAPAVARCYPRLMMRTLGSALRVVRYVALVPSLFVATAVAPAPAAADPPPSVDEYTETVPSGSGPQAVQGTSHTRAVKLAKPAQTRLHQEGGRDA